MKLLKIGIVAICVAFTSMAAEMPQTLRFKRVWEGRNVFDADIPFPDGVTFVPGAEYRGEVSSLPAAMRIIDESGAVMATFAAPTNVAPPYTMHFAITGIQAPSVFVTKNGKTSFIGRMKFLDEFDPRRSEYLRKLSVVPDGGMGAVSPRLSAGVGQADVRFVTHGREGRPYIKDGRMYFTFSARFFSSVTGVGSLDAAHPERGVRFEGVILYDYGDGLLRNDQAPHLFYDDETGEWRGWVCNFSTGTAALSKRADGGVNAVWSRKSPLHGLSVMKAKPLGLSGMNEDPCGVWDASAKKWRMFLCSFGEGDIRAQMLESDRWDGGYAKITERVAENSTGTTITWLGSRRYCLSGSSDRAYYVYSYPDLKKLGSLDMTPTPWGEAKGGPHGRGWPALAELPGGSPHKCILLTMDRVNFPGMPSPNWTYGALQIYIADRN